MVFFSFLWPQSLLLYLSDVVRGFAGVGATSCRVDALAERYSSQYLGGGAAHFAVERSVQGLRRGVVGTNRGPQQP